MLVHLALAALLSAPATSPATTLTVTSARNVTDARGQVNCAIVVAGNNDSRHDITISMFGSNATGDVNGVSQTRLLRPEPNPVVLIAWSPVRMVQLEYGGPCLATARYSFRLLANGLTRNLTHPAARQPALAGNRVMLGDLSAPFPFR